MHYEATPFPNVIMEASERDRMLCYVASRVLEAEAEAEAIRCVSRLQVCSLESY